MDARQLRCFLAVVDEGSFTRAATALLVAQPSLSQTIKGLERELGITLFHRLGRSVRLSEAGRELEGPARLVLRDLEAAKSHIQSLQGLRAGRVQIASMPSPGIEPLTTLVAGFTREHPEIVLDIAGTFTVEETIEAVRHGQAEIGLLGSHIPVRVARHSVIDLGEQPLMLAVNPHEDRWPDQPEIRPEGLRGARMVVSQTGSAMRAYADELIASGVALEIAAEVTHRTSILPLVSAGVGHAILPSAWVSPVDRMGLRFLTIAEAPSLHVSVVARADGLTPAAARFIRQVEHLAEHH
ncbi:LysR family transcriptional regulator [Brevibacterium daeguense]|uniref:LysR family transcriptional regulator n=1 Tax=Brevibacterium daeguense TaxID=909936 RepID=A0ABP8EID6_9MICO|nr:LysR family transcriptional regulator [Brevibacterium daeguense]